MNKIKKYFYLTRHYIVGPKIIVLRLTKITYALNFKAKIRNYVEKTQYRNKHQTKRCEHIIQYVFCAFKTFSIDVVP